MREISTMNGLLKSLTISTVLHGIAGCIIFALGTIFVQPAKPIVIDFDVGVPSQAGTGRDCQAKRADARKSKNVAKSGRVHKKACAVARAEAERVLAKPQDKVPKPQVEKTDPTAAVSENREGPQGPASTTATMSSGTVAGSSSHSSGSNEGDGAGNGRGPGGGSGKSSEQLRDSYLKEQFAYIRDMIQKNISYPARAKKMGWTGRVVVSFVIKENGRTMDEKICESSGFAVLDDNVIATIKEVAPFPRPRVSAKIKMPVVYTLE